MFCRNCGAELPDDAKFCIKCGQANSKEKCGEQKPEFSSRRKSKVKWMIACVIILAVICVSGVLIWKMTEKKAAGGICKNFPGSDSDIQGELGNFTVEEADEEAGNEKTGNCELTGINVVRNNGFENADFSMWSCMENSDIMQSVVYNTEDPFGVIDWVEDCYAGNYTFHFWSEYENAFEIAQIIPKENLMDGKYSASVQIQGDEVGESAVIYLFVRVNDQVYRSENVILTGYQEWKNPTISDIEVKTGDTVEIGVYVSHEAGGWGTIDEFELELQQSDTNIDGYLSDEQLCELARSYYEAVHDSPAPEYVQIEGEDRNIVSIWLYQDFGDHVATIDWYFVDRYTAQGTNTAGDQIDLKNP